MQSGTGVLIFNIIATVIGVTVLIPQTYKTWKTKDTCNVSLLMYIFYPINAVLGIVYASILIVMVGSIDSVGIIITDAISLIMAVSIAGIKKNNMKKAKKLNLTETQYYNDFIKNKKESKLLIKFEAKLKSIFKK